MAINDKFMLPKRVRTMEQMADLLAAEQAELGQTQRIVAALENQLTISTSTYLLPRHERLFALPVNTTESLEVRRARVLARLNTQGSTTVRAIRDMVEIVTGGEGDVIEHFGEYAFSVVVKLPAADAAASREELIKQIERIKPAHLIFDLTEIFQPICSDMRLGGVAACVVRLPMPELADHFDFQETIQVGGRLGVQMVMPVPEQS